MSWNSALYVASANSVVLCRDADVRWKNKEGRRLVVVVAKGRRALSFLSARKVRACAVRAGATVTVSSMMKKLKSHDDQLHIPTLRVDHSLLI